ncbi:flagellar biosynthesis anti-sigma factor FlgM [Tatumella ptyseos]|uniref:flagellar biosynthesis anti-sigma factor FlgM n=1 Tax=Tatumella ptyseos TaxID=82987 RepID=UPI0026F1B1F5|nr:flagellar biosynthesis anti-sigma factor FlgM [Tatumella ptyseos]WKX27709.1 flagellar biosynthesis anti-sigma factor FlgM [Tatumella ptyseos]
MTIEKIPGFTGAGNELVQGQSRSRPLPSGQRSHSAMTLENQSAPVALSHSLSRLSSLSSSDIDNEKVERLRQAIAEGNYHIDAGKIADTLLALSKEDNNA